MTRKIISIVAGFLSIAILSTVLAVLQGKLYPQTNQILGKAIITQSEIVLLLVKLVSILLSCVVGAIIATFINPNKQNIYIIATLIMLVIIWLWISAGNPIWFWILLTIGVIPTSLTGYYIAVKKRNKH